MKFGGVFMYASIKKVVCVGYKTNGWMNFGSEGLNILIGTEFAKVTGFGKVDGVDLIGDDMI
jgi:hypothetical protein